MPQHQKQQPHVESMSDKAVLMLARNGDRNAAGVLLRRWAIGVADLGAVMAAWTRLSVPSVTAAKRVALANRTAQAA